MANAWELTTPIYKTWEASAAIEVTHLKIMNMDMEYDRVDVGKSASLQLWMGYGYISGNKWYEPAVQGEKITLAGSDLTDLWDVAISPAIADVGDIWDEMTKQAYLYLAAENKILPGAVVAF